ncbi:hypothetical protein [Streptomyces sp. NPDC048442]|uniref:hypothetical protein n=1 Tax=Streptomyces sp. NPDC048442 TaxID=3154823 RepID=UPI003437A405
MLEKRDLHVAALRVFGRSTDGAVQWPYGLHNAARRRRWQTPESPEDFTRRQASQRAKQQAITEWATGLGLRRSQVGCCPRWLTRTTSRKCPSEPTHPEQECMVYGSDPRVGWLDHVIAWNLNGRPAVFTTAPYGLEDIHRMEVASLVAPDLQLDAAFGAGWYGFGTQQVILWRRDRIPSVPACDLPTETYC